MKEYKEEHNKLIVEGFETPTIIKNRTNEYLESSDEVKEWFKTMYDPALNDCKTVKDKVLNNHFVECKSVYDNYKQSSYYNLLSKKQKREQNLKWFYNYMQENINFKVFYKEKYSIGNKTYRHLLLDHKIAEVKDDHEPNFDEFIS